ncbi:hypothetical protein [Aurantiacibacter luteus]|nr:hypothetical protein [Aurantiacibacter luteus]
MNTYAERMISDRIGGDLAGAFFRVNWFAPVIVGLMAIVLICYGRDEDPMLEKARAGGEEI